MTQEEIGGRCAEFVTLHDRTQMNVQPMIDSYVRARFNYYWHKVELEYRSPQVMFEFYNIYARTVTPPDEQNPHPRGGSQNARERYVLAESFDRLKIIEKFLPFLRNGDDVDDLVSELYLQSHELMLKSWRLANSVAGYAVLQSFRQERLQDHAIKYVWGNLSQLSARSTERSKAFENTFLMKSPKEGEHSPLERLMETNWIEHMSNVSIDDVSMPEPEPLPSHEIEVLSKLLDRRTLIEAIRLNRERFLREPFHTEERWNGIENVFWAEFNREEVEVASLEEYGRRIGVSTERMRQLKVQLLRRVYKTYSNLVRGAWFAGTTASQSGLED